MTTLISMGRVALTVHDLERVSDFYRQAVGLHLLKTEADTVALGVGETVLLELRSRIADQVGARGGAHRIELLSRGGRPTPLAPDRREHVRPARKERVAGLRRCLADEAERVDAHAQGFRRMAGALPRLAV